MRVMSLFLNNSVIFFCSFALVLISICWDISPLAVCSLHYEVRQLDEYLYLTVFPRVSTLQECRPSFHHSGRAVQRGPQGEAQRHLRRFPDTLNNKRFQMTSRFCQAQSGSLSLIQTAFTHPRI